MSDHGDHVAITRDHGDSLLFSRRGKSQKKSAQHHAHRGGQSGARAGARAQTCGVQNQIGCQPALA